MGVFSGFGVPRADWELVKEERLPDWLHLKTLSYVVSDDTMEGEGYRQPLLPTKMVRGICLYL